MPEYIPDYTQLSTGKLTRLHRIMGSASGNSPTEIKTIRALFKTDEIPVGLSVFDPSLNKAL
jgi:hypothetical protein